MTEWPKPDEKKAESIGEKEQQFPTADFIRAERADLEKKITEAQKTKEENIGKTISDREALIGEAVKNDELFLATRDTIDYLKGMQELNQLDTESARKLEDYEALAKKLEDRGMDIKERIYKIAQNPEIKKRLSEEQEKEVSKKKDYYEKRDEVKALKAKLEQENKLFEKVPEDIAHGIKNLAGERNFSSKSLETTRKKYDDAEKDFSKSVIDNALAPLRKKGSEFLEKFRTLKEESVSLGEFIDSLGKERPNLGWFKGKEKAAIDYIIARKGIVVGIDEKEQEYMKAKLYSSNVSERIYSLKEKAFQYLISEHDLSDERNKKQRELDDLQMKDLLDEVYKLKAMGGEYEIEFILGKAYNVHPHISDEERRGMEYGGKKTYKNLREAGRANSEAEQAWEILHEVAGMKSVYNKEKRDEELRTIRENIQKAKKEQERYKSMIQRIEAIYPKKA